MSEKLSLTCNNFLENINLAFGNLRKEHEFVDVILACEDGQQIKAHKVILASSSPLFKNTRSYAALRAADLGWIVGPGYNSGGYILEKNHEKPTWNPEKP